MNPVQAHDEAWATMELEAAMSGLRSAGERALLALDRVAGAGGQVEAARRIAVSILREFEGRVRDVPPENTEPAMTWTFGDAKPWGLG